MTETSTVRPYTPHEILVEAHDKLVESYWVEGTEFDWGLSPKHFGPSGTSVDFDSEEYQSYLSGLPKYLWVKQIIDNRWEEGEYVPVVEEKPLTGMCSIGAIALANALIKDKPLAGFEELMSRDWASYHAGLVLNRCIWDNRKEYSGITESLSGQIAGWNDHNEREHVIEMFEQASKHPAALAEKSYVLSYQGTWSTTPSWTHYVFTDEEEFARFLEIKERYQSARSSDDDESAAERARLESDPIIKGWLQLIRQLGDWPMSLRTVEQGDGDLTIKEMQTA